MNPELRRKLQQDNLRKRELETQASLSASQVKAVKELESSMVQALSQLTRYLDGKVTKTQVVNQLEKIGTPDALKVMKAVNDMHSTLKKHKNTDLSEVTSLLKGMLKHVAQLPKELPSYESHEAVSVTNLPDFGKYYDSLEKAITGLDIKPQVDVKAPVVNVDAPIVQVEAPDFTTLQKSLKDVIKAVQSIVIPETKIDLKGLEKKQAESNKLLQELIEKPGPTFKTDLPFENEEGRLARITLTNEGKLPVDATLGTSIYKKLIDDTTTANVTYIGEAAPGTATSASNWRIKRIDETSGVAITWSGAGFTAEWDERALTVVYT